MQILNIYPNPSKGLMILSFSIYFLKSKYEKKKLFFYFILIIFLQPSCDTYK